MFSNLGDYHRMIMDFHRAKNIGNINDDAVTIPPVLCRVCASVCVCEWVRQSARERESARPCVRASERESESARARERASREKAREKRESERESTCMYTAFVRIFSDAGVSL